MSDYGEEIIDRLHENCNLRQTNNPVRKIIDNGVGTWFDNFDEFPFFDQVFITDAVNGYLDKHGNDFNVKRKVGESDEDYRQRIILESLSEITVKYLQEVYDLTLYTYVQDFNINNNSLTSDNEYINQQGFMTVASDEIQKILNKKFILGEGLHWLIL